MGNDNKMRCKLCNKSFRARTSTKNAHCWEKDQCPKCHYLGIFPYNVKKPDRYVYNIIFGQ